MTELGGRLYLVITHEALGKEEIVGVVACFVASASHVVETPFVAIRHSEPPRSCPSRTIDTAGFSQRCHKTAYNTDRQVCRR